MGFDCTLHLVDEHAIREDFIPWLLGQSQNEIALDRILKNAAKFRNTVRKALKKGDPDAAVMGGRARLETNSRSAARGVGLSPSPYAVALPVSCIVPLNGGNDVLLWNGDGYELQGDVFEKTFALELKNALGRWTSVPAGPDGFFYLSIGNLFEIHRGCEKIAHAEKWTNIRSVRPGPPGSLLLQEGDNF